MILLTSSIVTGFVRLCLLLLFLYYLNRKFVNRSDSNNFLEFLVHHWFRYGAIIALMLFATVQLGMYDLLNCLVILSLVMALDIVGVARLRNFRSYIDTFGRRHLLGAIKRVELRKPLRTWLDFKRKRDQNGKRYYIFILIVVLAAAAFGSRFYFLKFDQYALSSMWLDDLQKVMDFDKQIWFMNEVRVNGALAFTNFYGKISGVSPEMALESVGILESVLLSIVIFWVVRKITLSAIIASIAAAMLFALAFTLTPINIYFFLQSKPIFLAMSLGFPTMVYLLRPGLLKFRKHNYFFAILLAFVAIGLIDVFTLYVLFPPFILLAVIFTRRKSLSYFWLGLLAYLVASVIVLGIYAAVCAWLEIDLLIFMHSSLLSVSTYTYVPQLIIPFDRLVTFYQLGSWAVMAVLLIYIFAFREKWGASFAFLLYFNALVQIGNIPSSWIDTDLLNQALSVFMPVVVGIGLAAVLRIFKPVGERFRRYSMPVSISVAALLVGAAVWLQRGPASALTLSPSGPKLVLDAYDRISTTYFPYSYAVVNDNYTQVMSTDKHFFMNYSDFLYEYPAQDSIYFRHRPNPKFFKKNPQHVIPKSILLFVFEGGSDQQGDEGDISPLLMDQVAMLKKRGRKVEIFYERDRLRVYEIVNEPGESKIDDLIF